MGVIVIKEFNEVTIEKLIGRKSIRSYEHYILSDEETDRISAILKNPIFIKTALDWKVNPVSPTGSAFLFSELSEKNDDNLVEYGFQGQQLLMQLDMLNYGTCWLGRSPQKNIPSIIAFGKPKAGGIKGKFVKFLAGSDKRKELIELLKGNPHKLSIELASLLEACRWAPSAINRQPWLFEVSENEDKLIIHSNSPLDLGIVLANGFMAAKTLYEDVNIVKIEPNEYAIGINNKKER